MKRDDRIERDAHCAHPHFWPFHALAPYPFWRVLAAGFRMESALPCGAEERDAGARFGERWCEYAAHTPGFITFISKKESHHE